MKRLILWVALLSLTLCSCGTGGAGDADTTATTTEPTTSLTTAPHMDGIQYEKADNILTPEKLAAIPVANSEMTSQELRQICVDYIKLSVSCQWVSDATFYFEEADKDNVEKKFDEGKLYGGIPYVNMASGNLYRFMEYYDSETGILDTSCLVEQPELFATACSGTAGWAWARVINSVKISRTTTINQKHGFIPVGPYTYDPEIDEMWEWNENGEKKYLHDTVDICQENGKQVMFESYAQSHLADCFSRTGHVAMTVIEPVVVRNADGTINGKESYVELAEQGLYTRAKFHLRTTSDGTVYRIRGNDGRKFTFDTLYEKGFLVHTFAEFIGTDPVEEGKVTIQHRDDTATVADLCRGKIESNYPVSDVFTTVRDAEGRVVLEHVARTPRHFSKSLVANDFIPREKLAGIPANGTYTVEITARISTGETLPVYSGTLMY